MKKFLFATLAVLAMASFAPNANAQARYQGDISLSPGVSFGNGFTSFIGNIQTTQGFRINESWMAGLGLGFNTYVVEGEFAGYLPIVAHGKYYFNGEGPSLFLSGDVGYAFGVINSSGLNGFYFAPALGWQTSSNVFFGLGYQMHFTSGFNGMDNGVFARIGFKW